LRNGKKVTMVKIPAALLQRRNPCGALTLSPAHPIEEAKPMKRVPLALAAPLLLLAGCGQESAADRNADALERAAEQSTPEAADILRNAAPGSNVQEVLQAAGNAQAPTEAPPQQGAKPHAPGDPVPPPKVPAE
jgi:hypothetical protein